MPNESRTGDTYGELSRILAEFRADVRDDFAAINTRLRDDITALNARLDTFVLREVYNADKQAMQERMGRLEREAEAARSSARTAIYSCIATIIAGVLVGIILAILVTNGNQPK